MHLIITCCIVLHNMILEDERDELTTQEKEYFLEYDEALTEPTFFDRQPRNNNAVEQTPLCELMNRLVGLDNPKEHFSLRHDLSVYLWNNRSG